MRMHSTPSAGTRIRRENGEGYVLHRGDLQEEDRGWWEGMPITTLERTLLDCVSWGTRAKGVAIEYLERRFVPVGSHNNYASLKSDGTEYFLNPQRSRLSVDWTIVLNNTDRHELVVLEVPAGSLRMADGGRGGLMPKSNNASQMDLHLSVDGLKDRRSGVDFSKYLVGRVTY